MVLSSFGLLLLTHYHLISNLNHSNGAHASLARRVLHAPTSRCFLCRGVNNLHKQLVSQIWCSKKSKARAIHSSSKDFATDSRRRSNNWSGKCSDNSILRTLSYPNFWLDRKGKGGSTLIFYSITRSRLFHILSMSSCTTTFPQTPGGVLCLEVRRSVIPIGIRKAHC